MTDTHKITLKLDGVNFAFQTLLEALQYVVSMGVVHFELIDERDDMTRRLDDDELNEAIRDLKPRHEKDRLLNVEALRRYQRGERPRVSTGIDDCTTLGYGRLDAHGFWEFPLYVRQLRADDPLREVIEKHG